MAGRMSTQVLAALISGLVALAVASGGGFLTWVQIRRERYKWQVDVKLAYALELQKTRIASYPEVFQTLLKLSHGPGGERTPRMADEVAGELNSWFYSLGGMCADASTRGAILGLRLCCEQWAKTGDKPEETEGFRNLSVYLLRRDLDVGGLEEYDFVNPATMLEKLKTDVAAMQQRESRRRQPEPDNPILFRRDHRPQTGEELLTRMEGRVAPKQRAAPSRKTDAGQGQPT
jgi:hypothetical protein